MYVCGVTVVHIYILFGVNSVGIESKKKWKEIIRLEATSGVYGGLRVIPYNVRWNDVAGKSIIYHVKCVFKSVFYYDNTHQRQVGHLEHRSSRIRWHENCLKGKKRRIIVFNQYLVLSVLKFKWVHIITLFVNPVHRGPVLYVCQKNRGLNDWK